MPQSKRYELISQKLNIPSIENYVDWLPGNTIKGINLDNIFKEQNVLSAAISEQKIPGINDRIFKYFNNGEAGSNA